MKLRCYQTFCCCFDAAFGSIVAAAMTVMLSLVFMGLSIERVIKASKLHSDTDYPSETLLTSQDVAILKAIPAVNLILSILLLIASMALIIGAAHKRRKYVAVWIIVMPLWLIFCITQLALTGNTKYRWHDAFENDIYHRGGESWYIVVGVVIAMSGLYGLGCVAILLHTLLRSEPVLEFKRMSVSDTLQVGFRSGYSRLRESVRYFSRRSRDPPVNEAYQSRVNVNVESGVCSTDPVVLNPGKLEGSSNSTQSDEKNGPVMSMTNLAYTHDEF